MNVKKIEKIKNNYDFQEINLDAPLETRGQRISFAFFGDGKKYVYKEGPQSPEKIQRVEALVWLNKYNFPALEIVKTHSGKFYVEDEESFFYIYSYIEGKEGRPSSDYFYALGKLLAQLHSFDSGSLALPKVDLTAQITELKKRITKNSQNPAVTKELTEALNSIGNLGTQSSLVHLDPSFYNTIVNKDGIFLIDFDNLSLGSPLFDVARVVVFMAHLVKYDFPKLDLGPERDEVQFYEEWLREFLRGYGKCPEFTVLWNYILIAACESVFQKHDENIFEWNYKRYQEIIKNKIRLRGLF